MVTVGRYVLHREIARGGMATIHIARLMGDEGFSRIVAAKRLLPELAEDSEFVAMFLDEARIASKVHHRNVVPVLDLVTTADDVMLVQEYVHGVPLHALLRAARQHKQHIPVRIAVAIATQVLAGLHAAHETTDEMGAPLHIVHRDVSPQNIMVAIDGSARLLDFGVAKATLAGHVTRSGSFKGKLAYSAPEQMEGKANRQSDVYALAVVLWELIVGHRLHGTAQGEAELVATVMAGNMPSLCDTLSSEAEWGALDPDEWQHVEALDPIVSRGFAVSLDERWPTAAAMERALVEAVPPATVGEVAAWLKSIGKDLLDVREQLIAAEEQSWRSAPERRMTVPATPASLHHAPSQVRLRIATTPGTVRTDNAQPFATARYKVIAGVVALLALLIGGGLVLALNVPSAKTPEKPAPALAANPPPPPPATAVNPPPPSPALAVNPPPPAPDQPAPSEVVAAAKPAQAAPARAATVRRRVHVVAKAAEPPPPPPPVETPAPAPEPPKDDCDPPYYFQGDKKVFKPSCL
jgi:serine/threonine-protein kinase